MEWSVNAKPLGPSIYLKVKASIWGKIFCCVWNPFSAMNKGELSGSHFWFFVSLLASTPAPAYVRATTQAALTYNTWQDPPEAIHQLRITSVIQLCLLYWGWAPISHFENLSLTKNSYLPAQFYSQLTCWHHHYCCCVLLYSSIPGAPQGLYCRDHCPDLHCTWNGLEYLVAWKGIPHLVPRVSQGLWLSKWLQSRVKATYGIFIYQLLAAMEKPCVPAPSLTYVRP